MYKPPRFFGWVGRTVFLGLEFPLLLVGSKVDYGKDPQSVLLRRGFSTTLSYYVVITIFFWETFGY